MSQLKYAGWKFSRISLGVILTLASASFALAQQKPGDTPAPAGSQAAGKDVVSGKYEGTAKAEGTADVKLTLELKNESGSSPAG